MILQLNELRDKLAGCWTGKNVGGVLGAPFECKRMIPNVDFYVQDLTQGPPANDDLDLQIVWLAAVERYGRNVNASILGEYWLSFVIPNWVEYGTGKTNLRAGLKQNHPLLIVGMEAYRFQKKHLLPSKNLVLPAMEVQSILTVE